ncbi:unnamed protein product [Rotaria sordida]|uniref:Uncharacterized protein n=1 Tax=Rotaria sordida TaxID=392033 RepID=A0A815DE42_9BILA|nr:unnamed protein product [Rotaria sordida]
MPMVTRTGSSQNVSEKNVQGKAASSSTDKTNIINKKTKKKGKRLNENVRTDAIQTTAPKRNQRPLSPVIQSPPSKKLKINNDDLIARIEASDKQDLVIQQQLRQVFEKSGSTTSGSTIVYTASLHVQSDSENEDDTESNENEKSQEYPLSDDGEDDKLDKINYLEAQHAKLMNDYKKLNSKYQLLVDKYNKVTQRQACERTKFMEKPPPIVLKWMSHVLNTAEQQEQHVERTSTQCGKIISDAAEKLKTARKLVFVIWPEPNKRARVNAKTVDREKLKLIYDICEALHPELEKNESVLNTSIYNVCASTRTKSKRASTKLNVTQNSNNDDIVIPPLIMDEHEEHDSNDEEEEEEEEHEDVEATE